MKDAVDRLEWSVRIGTDFYGFYAAPAYALFCEGRIAFRRESVPGNSMPGPQHPVRTLPARWINRDVVARMVLPRETVFQFASDLPGDAFDRLEAFRDGGRLFARWEGKLWIVKGPNYDDPNASIEHFLMDFGALMEGTRKAPAIEVRTESFELTRDFWCEGVLATLRPPGRCVFDVPAGPTGSNGAAEAAVHHWNDARAAFDHGRYAETARVCARCLEELNKFLGDFEARYGEFGRARLAEQIKSTKSLCDPVRHAEKPHHDRLNVDRPLAQHILVVTGSLLGMVTQ